MAKKRNLLLTTLLAVVCLTALLVASFVVGGGESPAQAETRTGYVKSESTKISASNAALIVHKSGEKYYAMTMGSSLTVTEVFLTSDGAQIDTEKTNVTNKMLWKIAESSGMVSISCNGDTRYNCLNVSRAGAVSLSGVATPLDGSNNKLQEQDSDYWYYIVGGDTGYSGSYSSGTEFLVFNQQEVEVVVQYITITLTIDGQPDATRTMQVESGKTTTLPNPDTSDLWETKPTPDGKQFSHWINESGEQVLDAFSSTADVTLTAVFAEPVTYEKSTATQFETSSKPILLGMLFNSQYYWVLSANGVTSIKAVSLGAVGDTITDTSKINNDMLWIIETSNTSLTLKNVGTNKYLSLDSSSPTLVDARTELAHDYKLQLRHKTNYSKYLKQDTSTISIASSSQTTWVIYQQPVPSSTISFTSGNNDATGSMTAVEKFANGKEYSLPACGYTLAKHKFAGWKIQGDESGTLYQRNDKVTINEDTTFVATWTYDYCAVTFELDGHTSQGDKEYQKGSYSLPKIDAVFPDYEVPANKFADGWLDKATNKKVSSVPQAESVTLIPNLVDAIYLKLDLNGGTRNTTSTSSYDDLFTETGRKIKKGDNYFSVEAANTYSMSRADYTFDGWIRSDNGEKMLVGSHISNITENLTLTAQWIYSGYTIKFMNGETLHKTLEIAKNQSSITIHNETDESQMGELVSDPELTGWTFAGWRNSADNTMLPSTKTIALSGAPKTITFVATYKKDIVLTFVYDNATVYTATIADAPYDGNTLLTAGEHRNEYKGYPDKLPNGKLFDHWELADGTVITQITNKSGDATIKIVAKDGFKITFDLNGGSQNSTLNGDSNAAFGVNYVVEVTGGSAAISTMQQPYRDAYILDGWKCGELTVKSGESFDVTSDMKFVAQWKFDGTMLTFKADGQEDEQVPIASGTESYVIAVNDPTVAQGKVFLGWKIEGDSSDTLYKKGETLTIPTATDAMTLIAQVRDLETYTVTLHYGEQTATLQFVEGTSNIQILESTFTEKFGTLEATKKYHGWYTDAEFANEFSTSFHNADGQDVKTMDLYAKVTDVWTVKFTFYPKADSVTRTNNDGKGVPTLIVSDADAVKMDGYNLIGWSKTMNGEIAYSALSTAYGITIKESCELFAIWQITTEGQAALDKAIADAKTELTAYAQGLGVSVPATTAIDSAKFVEEVAAALTEAKAAADATAAQESKAKVDAAKAAVAALSGKTGEALFNQLKAVDAAIADLSAEEKAQVDLTAYNTVKAQLEALVSGAEADLEAANTAGATIAAAKIGAAVAALASLAALAFVLKRGIL